MRKSHTVHGATCPGTPLAPYPPAAVRTSSRPKNNVLTLVAPAVRRPQARTLLGECLRVSKATHVCSTPSIWTSSVDLLGFTPESLPHLRVVALGGEKMAAMTMTTWGQGTRDCSGVGSGNGGSGVGNGNTSGDAKTAPVVLLNTYGVTEVIFTPKPSLGQTRF